METNPEIEFEFYLAAKLGMTVAGMRAGMSSLEFTEWGIYYARQAQRAELERLKAKG